MSDIFEELIRIRSAGHRAALATIVGVKGSSPGKNSMKMLVREDGTFLGTVGGGCMEAEVWEAAKSVMESEEPRLLSFTLTEDDMPDSGLICGGTVTVFVESVGAPTAYLFGAGHLSRAICQVARLAGFRVAVIDDRPQFSNKERFPQANEVYVEAFEGSFDRIPLARWPYVVIVTRGHKHDEVVLEQALKRETKYIGMIGSRRKIDTAFSNIEKRGRVARREFARVRAPIGLEIGAQSHEEIAVATVAEMIAVRRLGDGAVSRDAASEPKASPGVDSTSSPA